MVVAPARPVPVTLAMLRNAPLKPETSTFLMAAFLMFARKMPLPQVPVTFSRVKTVERFVRMDTCAVDEDGYVGDLDVGETEVLMVGMPSSPGTGSSPMRPEFEDVEAEEAAGGAGDFEVGGGDVFDEGSAAGSGLDVDGEGLCGGEFAVADADVADSAGGFGADAECRRRLSRRRCSWRW